MGKQTSRVFATHDALYDLLEAETWPVHPSTGKTPKVVDSDMQPPYPAEMIIVVGSVAGPGGEFVTMGTSNSKDEQFTLQVAVVARTPNVKTARKVRARLAELCAVVQDAVRDPDSGKTAGGFSASAGDPGPLWWSCSPPTDSVFQIEGGFAGYSELNITFNARI